MRAFLISLSLLLAGQSCLAAGMSSDSLGNDIYARARFAFEHVLSTSYKRNHKTAYDQIEENDRTGGLSAATDSSGFISWVLFGVSPGHLIAIQGESDQCPDASSFAKFFAAIPRREMKDGWLNVPSALELTRGDLIAVGGKSKNKKDEQGRVMIVVSSASAVQKAQIGGRTVQYVSVQVIDSSPSPHFGPEVLPPLVDGTQRNGLGVGTVGICVDGHGKPTDILFGQKAEDGVPSDATVAMARAIGPARLQEASTSYLDYEAPRAKRTAASGHSH